MRMASSVDMPSHSSPARPCYDSAAMKKRNLILGLVILAVVGAAWLFSINGGWLVLNILVVLVVIPIALVLCLIRMLRRRRREGPPPAA